MVLDRTSCNWNATQTRWTFENTKAMENNDLNRWIRKRERVGKEETKAFGGGTHRCREVTYFIKRRKPANQMPAVTWNVEDEGNDQEKNKNDRICREERRKQSYRNIWSPFAIWWEEVLLLDKRHENELFSSTVHPRLSSLQSVLFLLSLFAQTTDFSILSTAIPVTNDAFNEISHIFSFALVWDTFYLVPSRFLLSSFFFFVDGNYFSAG